MSCHKECIVDRESTEKEKSCAMHAIPMYVCNVKAEKLTTVTQEIGIWRIAMLNVRN